MNLFLNMAIPPRPGAKNIRAEGVGSDTINATYVRKDLNFVL
jgi:hypothetical protein